MGPNRWGLEMAGFGNTHNVVTGHGSDLLGAPSLLVQRCEKEPGLNGLSPCYAKTAMLTSAML